MTTNIAFIHTIILEILNSLSLASKYPVLFSFFSKLKTFNGLNLRKEASAYNNASQLYNEYLEISFNQYMAFSGGKKRKLDEIISYLFLVDTHNWYENKESAHPARKSDKEESDIPP